MVEFYTVRCNNLLLTIDCGEKIPTSGVILNIKSPLQKSENIAKCHSELVSESNKNNKLRDPETSSG